MSLKRRLASKTEDLNEFVTFSGTISRDELVVPIRFRVRFGVDGELRFRVYPLPMTEDSLALRIRENKSKSNKRAVYALSAVSAGGTRLQSDNILLRGTGTASTSTTAHVTLKLNCTRATFTRDQDNGDTPPTVRWSLRGFEAFPAVEGECVLGKVVWAGNYPERSQDRVTGVATIRANGPVTETAKWTAEVDRLFEHIRLVMSLAMSRQVDYPVRDIWIDGQWRRDAFSQTKSRRSNAHLFHPMVLQPAFDAALASHFNPPVAASGLDYAVEWLTMHTTYSEMRLTNAITALEHLVNANMSEDDQFYLDPKSFDAFSKRLRDFATVDLEALTEDRDEAFATAAMTMRAGMKSKLLDLNRPPLLERVLTLAQRWNVPLDGLDGKELRAAIPARNTIVHRGYYYHPGRAKAEHADLWDHVLIIRELAARFVLTAIGYRGTYLSFRGGQHDVSFPPVATATPETDAQPPAS